MIDKILIQQLEEIARQAGLAILSVYDQEDLGIQTKQDSTPVTEADLKANAIIEEGLKSLSVQYPILSEESPHTPYTERKHWHRYWLVDPLDGTQEFIKRNGQFSVNIALIEEGYPLFGMVHIPTTNTSYWGGKGMSAFRQKDDQPPLTIHPRPLDSSGEVIILGSRSYATDRAQRYLEQLKNIYPTLTSRKVGSSLKSCHIAEGQADIYPRLGPTSEWDTAAVQAVVEGAGGLFLNPEGQRFAYNWKESLLNSDFLVLGDSDIDWSSFWNKDMLSI
ncbi:3'(2'),5'-bisphosphate nucleotidase [Endozoicomonas sp. (ex Bugula neritina AB1)]|nr:3'(2'),5'-bisphosphate nucleotidase [Endozoicomonas sp. (ex Bugula neritina AB1)]